MWRTALVVGCWWIFFYKKKQEKNGGTLELGVDMLVGRVVSWPSTSEYRKEQKKNIYLLGVDTLGLSDRLYVGVTSPRVLG